MTITRMRRHCAPVAQRGIVVLCALVALASCASHAPEPPPPAFSRLGEGAIAYLRLEVSDFKPFLIALIEKSGLSSATTILKRTDVADLAFYPKESGRRFALYASGHFPSTRLGIGLCLSPSWEEETLVKGRDYWASDDGLSLELDATSAFLSNGKPFESPSVPQIPADAADSLGTALAVGWLADPSAFLASVLSSAGQNLKPPIRSVVFCLVREAMPGAVSGEAPAGSAFGYRLTLDITANQEREARAFGAIIRIAGNLVDPQSPKSSLRLLALVAGEKSALNGNHLELKTPVLSESEFALLCQGLLVYFNP